MTTTVLDRPLAPAGGEPTEMPALQVRNVSVSFRTRDGLVRAINDISFTLGAGRILAILGESSSGKIVLLRTMLRIQAQSASVDRCSYTVRISSVFRRRSGRAYAARRSPLFQNPLTTLDSVYTVEQQIVESIRRHTSRSASRARDRSTGIVAAVQIDFAGAPPRPVRFELSGGIRQRVVIAMALACSPRVLLAHEPTTALDVTLQARVLDLFRDIRQELGTTIILVMDDVVLAAKPRDRHS